MTYGRGRAPPGKSGREESRAEQDLGILLQPLRQVLAASPVELLDPEAVC
jgi:hypothetical protein